MEIPIQHQEAKRLKRWPGATKKRQFSCQVKQPTPFCFGFVRRESPKKRTRPNPLGPSPPAIFRLTGPGGQSQVLPSQAMQRQQLRRRGAWSSSTQLRRVFKRRSGGDFCWSFCRQPLVWLVGFKGKPKGETLFSLFKKW